MKNNAIKLNINHFNREAFNKFDALAHVRHLHPSNSNNISGGREGYVSFAQRVPDREKPWKEWTVAVNDAPLHAQALLEGYDIKDIYMSQNSFNKWRNIANLKAVGACYVDIDYITRKTWEDMEPNAVLNGALDILDEKRIPFPSFVLSTGRGLLAVWLHNLLPRSILPKWQIVQQTLADSLTSLGADKRALDGARVFRLAGSINSKATSFRDKVSMIWSNGSPDNPKRYEFSEIADDILPLTKAELVSLRAERAKRKAEGKDTQIAPSMKLSGATYWEAVLTDLQKLRAYRHTSGGLPSGHRDIWMFLATNAISWISPPEVLNREYLALAREATGWSDAEAKSRMGAILKRAKASAEGKKIEFNGNEVDPRYRISATRMVEWLEIDPTEQREAGLRCLIDGSRKREVNAERSMEFRKRKGANSRSQVQEERLILGQQACFLAIKEGLSIRELAERFQVSLGQMSRAMKEARENKTA